MNLVLKSATIVGIILGSRGQGSRSRGTKTFIVAFGCTPLRDIWV